MNLILTIAWTHVRHRARQTLVAIIGVMTGVGFSIMMAAMMEGSQDDFIKTLVDALPHISITDESREPTRQPATMVYQAVEMHGLTPQVRRPGIKNPMAMIASLQSWVPGALTPSVQSKALLRFAGRNLNISIVGIDPRSEINVSNLATHMRQGTLNSLYRSSNAILLGDRLAAKIGARVNSNITLASAEGANMNATVVGTFHSGFRTMDEGTGYVLLKTAQILERQTGIVNEIRVRTDDPMAARLIAERIGEQTGYKSISWQEAQEDLLSAITLRNVLMYTIVGAILLVASFGTYNIISTITHEKTRDIAIMKSLGFRDHTIRAIFIVEALLIGLTGAALGWVFGYLLTRGLGSLEFKTPFSDYNHLPVLYSVKHYLLATSFALISSLIAGYFPARAAARLHPVDIIRGAT
ncbi:MULTISPECIES: ABC transporter permease [Rhodopseudomonas]|uniref:ABC transporter n=1 Tax=Rhodopseudomonas palustris TaxID=1076 RepID=A0A0D7EFE1_RHOPL|nr:MULTISPECIES: ABC transporter permease [Rhodopseudomonas]KIZ39458.1 ABC transporter [Rhodopseudomonas palustris]MDF3812357.1 ABC transporter permease [Rhodopseudomonas sp. BAL398]WOK16134.1 ABC transporter permease [Rhodopseudomonas sp. BAL398]